ncbi:MAG: NERD domain-containing protein, partial [Bradymonadaceae bacterium]
MNFLKRLWVIARNRKRFRPRSEVRAGRVAESKSARILEDQLAGTSRRVWASRRIPDHITGRRREFDFLVAGQNTLLSIELKN